MIGRQDLSEAITTALRSDNRRACLTTELRLSVKHRFISYGLPQFADNDWSPAPPGTA